MTNTIGQAISPTRAAAPWSRLALRWSGLGLVSASWFSAAIFGAYILAFYVGAIPARHPEQWNGGLPGLYDSARPLAILAIGAHFAMGGVLLVLGPVQLIGAVRRRWPSLHRWLGRVYVVAAGLAGLGGLIFIAGKGTIGGTPMNVGFGLYGALMVAAALQTYLLARARGLEAHRRWAFRLFALAIGSWLYRMDYGFWSLIADGAGHTQGFDGPFDVVMAFFFYIPNLIVAELFIHARRVAVPSAVVAVAVAALNLGTFFVALGTYYFTLFYWGPGILDAVSGRSG